MIPAITAVIGVTIGHIIGGWLAGRVHRHRRENHAMRQHAKFTRALARTARTNIGDA